MRLSELFYAKGGLFCASVQKGLSGELTGIILRAMPATTKKPGLRKPSNVSPAVPASPRGTVSLDWRYRGLAAVVLENEKLRVVALPELGAEINQLIDKRLDRNRLFHHPRVELRPPVFGSNADNWWTGGIDDGVPTGHPCTVGGELLPFLGKVWSKGNVL